GVAVTDMGSVVHVIDRRGEIELAHAGQVYGRPDPIPSDGPNPPGPLPRTIDPGGPMRTARLCAALLVCCCGCPAALGQNALGTGRGFERDIRVGGTGNAPRADMRDELRMRNALVTGNVSGGKSLQIARPYADADDFRAALGTDQLFRFRRDS